MKFSLRLLIATVTYCCVIFAALHYLSIAHLGLPVHVANVGVVYTFLGHRPHAIELVVWLPVTIMVSYGYFRVVTAPWKPRLSS